MSYNNFNKNVLKFDDNADRNSNEQENLNTTINMDLVKKEEAVRQRTSLTNDSENFICVDVENSIGPSLYKNDKTNLDVGQLKDEPQLRTSGVNQSIKRKRFTILGMYDQIFGHAQQQTNPPRYGRQMWRQQLPPQQQQSPIWTQYGPGQGPSPGSGQGQTQGQGYEGYYQEPPQPYDPRSRNPFIALVMSIVFVMLLATAGFIITVLTVPDLKLFFIEQGWMPVIPAFIGMIGANYVMMCSPCGRRPPCNFVMLIIVTASMSVIAAKITTHYRTEIILYSVLATGAAVFVCILLACSKFDFTSWLLYVVVIMTGFSAITMLILVMMMVTGTMMKPLLIVVLVIGTILQIVMLTMELQMILGGRTIEIDERDYALAAFLLYTSILDLFLKLVHIFGLTDG